MIAQPVVAEFSGRVAVITGAGSGIGRASALALAERGAAVVIVDRILESAEETADTVLAAGGKAFAVTADVALPEGVDLFTATAVERFGRLDVLHANAAVQWFGNVLDCTDEQWDRMFAVNLRGIFLAARRCIPEMLNSGGGSIVATCSDCAIRTSPQAAAYTATKTGLIGLIRSIAVDFGPHGIRANLVTPGLTDTPGLRALYSQGTRTPEEGMGRAAALSPLGRVGTPEDLGEAVAFLCSDRAKFITGANLIVDGGMTVTYGID